MGQTPSRQHDTLLEMGFQSYDDYLKSPLWGDIRRRVFRRAEHFCECCSVQASQVHHFQYSLDVLIGRDINPLAAVCTRCHNLAHFDAQGLKRSLFAANRRLFESMVRKDRDNAQRIAHAMGYTRPPQENGPLLTQRFNRDPSEKRYHWGGWSPNRPKQRKQSKTEKKAKISLKREACKQARLARQRRIGRGNWHRL